VSKFANLSNKDKGIKNRPVPVNAVKDWSKYDYQSELISMWTEHVAYLIKEKISKVICIEPKI
jgi:hypothetical protein